MLKQKHLHNKQKITHQHKLYFHFRKRSKYDNFFKDVLNFSKVILLSSFTVFLIFATPNAFANSFDEESCLSLISVDKVKEITKFDGTLDVNIINTNLESLNEGVSSGCAIAFQNEDTSF